MILNNEAEDKSLAAHDKPDGSAPPDWWPAAPVRPGEAERLAALHALELLDTADELAFDRLVGLAADVFQTPIALVTLIDSRRQWFKARRGLALAETPRDYALCAYAIAGDGVCLVPDSTQDDRFARNPLVTGDPKIRFYAGAPLTLASGHRIGTLCVIDTKPRHDFGLRERSILERLAVLVVDEIELRLARQRLRRQRSDLLQQATELSAMRELANRSSERLQNLIDNLPVGVVMMDAELRIAAFNRSSLALLNLPTELFYLGARIQDILTHLAQAGEFGAPAKAAAAVRDRLRVLRRGQTVRIDRTRPDGRVLEVLGSPMPDGGYLALYLDVSESRRREEDLVAAKNAAEAANHAKTEFLSNVSHEIRTPLNGIIGMNGLLLRTSLGPEQRHYATAVRESAETLLALINDLLDIAKLEAGKVELESTRFDPENLLGGVLELLAPRAADKAIELVAVVDPGTPLLVCADQMRLRQVLINLVGNAIKFTERGRVELRLSATTLGQDPPELRFEVADTGIGLRPEDRPRLFQKFSQADGSITRRFGGTGLGLAISRELVELMGGRIGVESEIGRGSTFWFTIRAMPIPSGSTRPEAGPLHLAGYRALVVGSAVEDRSQLRRLLEGEGLLVTEAEEPFAAFLAMEEATRDAGGFALAFLDQGLAALPAASFAQSIRRHERFAAVKLVLLHPLGSPPASDQGASAFDATLGRPVRRQALRQLLRGLFAAAGEGKHDKAGSTPAPQHAGPVLLAEDNRINQEIVLALLREEGLEADVVGNGAEALEALARRNYGLVLMDVQMPVLDGIEATRSIRALPGAASRIPVIAMTAHAMSSDRLRCLQAGMDDYLSKPLDPVIFRAMLQRHLHSRAADAAVPGEPCAAPGGDPDPLDRARLDSLARTLPPDQIRMIVANWRTQAAATIAEVRHGAERQDFQELSRLAHSLKGSASMVGVARLSKLMAELEGACAAEDGLAVRRLAQDAAAELDRAAKALDKL